MQHASSNVRVLAAIFLGFSCWCRFTAATEFAGTGRVSAADADSTLISELVDALGTGEHTGRLKEFEVALQKTFASLPKGADGYLGFRAVRYVLHRLFVQRHGWYIKGLEPNGDTAHTIVNTSAATQEWVPTFLLNRLEARLGDRGVNLQELAALAAALEDLVNKEADGRIETAYKVHELSTSSRITPKQAEDVIDTYMLVYLLGGKLSANSEQELQQKKSRFHTKYAGWKEADAWLHNIEGNRLASHSADGVDFATTKKIAEEIGEQYNTFNDKECADLKSTLMKMESRSRKAGRVRLTDFYNMSLYSHWQFTEKAEYLRSIGALDETDGPGKTSVVIPNYLTARPNCLEASSLYSMCCRDECEDLLGHLEEKIAAPAAHADTIARLVAALPSDTVAAPRKLPDTLLRRLKQIAQAHGGEVNIHGRLFSQWMHHAYPRECPYPAEAGHTSPQTADEWMAKTGHASSSITAEEMKRYVNAISQDDEKYGTEAELPWSDAEQLLEAGPQGGKMTWLSLIVRLIFAGPLVAFGVWAKVTPEGAKFFRIRFGHRSKASEAVALCAFVVAGMILGVLNIKLSLGVMFLGGAGVFAYKHFFTRGYELLPGGEMIKGRGARYASWGKHADKMV